MYSICTVLSEKRQSRSFSTDGQLNSLTFSHTSVVCAFFVVITSSFFHESKRQTEIPDIDTVILYAIFPFMQVFKVIIIISSLSWCSARNAVVPNHDFCSHPLNWRNVSCTYWLEDHGLLGKEEIADKNNQKGGSPISGSSRIVGGTDAPFGAYPWFAKPVMKFLGVGLWEGMIL
jgi:hypothetical protein